MGEGISYSEGAPMKRHRRSARRANQTTVELLEDRQLLTADFGDATLLSDQGLIPGPELQDLRLGGTGVTMFPEQFALTSCVIQ